MIPQSYRLEDFDFSSFPALTGNHSLNAGPEDQRLGMEWIRRNIQLWGNPHNIVVFGAYAGAHCLQRHLTVAIPPCGYAAGHVNDLATRYGGHKHQPQGTAAPKVFSTSADSGVRLDRLRCLPLDNMLLYTPILEKSNTTYYRVLHSSDLAFIFDIRQRQQYQAPRQHKSGSGMPYPLLGRVYQLGELVAGSVALPEWTEIKRQGNSGYEVRIIGGPSDRMAAVSGSMEGVLTSGNLIQPCAF